MTEERVPVRVRVYLRKYERGQAPETGEPDEVVELEFDDELVLTERGVDDAADE